MSASPKKKTTKKKASHSRQANEIKQNEPKPEKKLKNIIRYSEERLKPEDGKLTSIPIYAVVSRETHILPGQMARIPLGLEVALAPGNVMLMNKHLFGFILDQSMLTGHIAGLSMDGWNKSDQTIVVKPYQKIGELFLFQASEWN